ncbi:Ldh family oxidoreductase [Aureimonas altamirensis]|uniref:Ldh family oxidoreductase n=1 Tax=Aureimonas altamirensis TaxID=370622 RepID=UPI002037065E|nr:Ldh family oxidoreductase [Aureimonas altamirensis]MCM2502638.1 Ldh family oxidoreductase [Aureimonas altamirensis]
MENQNEKTVVAEAELQRAATDTLIALGLGEVDASDTARILVLADLFGVSTHGTSRIQSYGERLALGGIAARPDIRIERVAPGIARVDGDNGVGPLVGQHSLRAAMDLARENGIGIALARGSNHFGPVGPYCYVAAESGFASFIGSNATTTIAPWGGREARLGNSPIGFGIPNPGGSPIILDMAMSVVARAKIRNAAKQGRAIPSDWATNRAGVATEDPNEALDGFLQPIGGHKGYGLALIVDLLAGVLSDAAYLSHVRSWVDTPDQPQNLGHFFILLDTSRLGSASWLAARVRDFSDIIHSTPSVGPENPVLLPGEIELTNLARQRRHGISIDSETMKFLSRYAGA